MPLCSHSGLVCNLKGKPNSMLYSRCMLIKASDIVAEMSLPRSGILTYEDFMPGPNIKAAQLYDGIDRVVTESYSAQLSLRKHLNVLHTQFYKRGNGKHHGGDMEVQIVTHIQIFWIFPTRDLRNWCSQILQTQRRIWKV